MLAVRAGVRHLYRTKSHIIWPKRAPEVVPLYCGAYVEHGSGRWRAASVGRVRGAVAGLPYSCREPFHPDGGTAPSRDLGRPYARSTIDDKLTGRSVPDWDFVETFVRACARYAGTTPAAIDLDSWRTAHRELREVLGSRRGEPACTLPCLLLFGDGHAGVPGPVAAPVRAR